MKQLLFLLGLAGIGLISCNKKDTVSTPLSGNWRMVAVYDKNTGTTLFPPGEDGNDLVLSFKATGFSGHTLNNSISDGAYTIPGVNKIRLSSYSSTDLGEDSWGGIFFSMLSSCLLQSVYPCTPLDFTIVGDTLEIDVPLLYSIKFEKF